MDKRPYQYRPGGLMRCCTLTLALAYESPRDAAAEEDKLPCRYCSSTMIFTSGAWEWDKSRTPIHGVAIPAEAELAP